MKRPEFILILLLCLVGEVVTAQRPDFLLKDSIQSSLDGNTEVFYYNKSASLKSQPLVVELHTWSNNSHSQEDLVAQNTKVKDWNYILPNFRGVNNSPKACCSEFAIADIDETIDWAIKNMHIDINKIYVVGYSGGAYATFAMYMKSRHNINSFSAWCGISDLTAWYNQSLERKNKYSVDILRCTDSGDTLNVLKAKERSPLYWSTPVKKRKRSQLQIYAGIHDGYTGSVPISHSINFYNKVLHDLNVKDKSPYIPKDDEDVLIKSRNFPNVYAERKIDGRLIYYQKAYQKISITIFDGGHEILRDVVLDRLENTVQ